jgi:TM2 domain-containing membrane protein YozV
LGIFGVDRFVLGEVGLGVVKMLTFGQFFIGFVLDSFTIFDRTRNYYYEWFLQIKLRNQAYLSNY